MNALLSNPDDAPRRGRPPKCVVELALVGNARRDIAAVLGVPRRTFARWLRRGAKHPASSYGTFARELRAAEAQFVAQSVASITAAARERSPRLMLKFLERRWPRLYGRFRGELGALKGTIREQSKQIAELERRVRALLEQPAPSDTHCRA